MLTIKSNALPLPHSCKQSLCISNPSLQRTLPQLVFFLHLLSSVSVLNQTTMLALEQNLKCPSLTKHLHI